MRILTLNNTAYDLNEIPDEVEDLRFAVLDNSDPKNPDYFYIPLIFLESFNSPALVLKIGDSIIKMPVDWQLLIGEHDLGDLEVVPLTSINDRGFSVFCFNPLSSFKPEFKPVVRKDDRERWNDWGIGMLLQGDLKGAEYAFQRVTEAEPEYADGWLNVARALIQEDRKSTRLNSSH